MCTAGDPPQTNNSIHFLTISMPANPSIAWIETDEGSIVGSDSMEFEVVGGTTYGELEIESPTVSGGDSAVSIAINGGQKSNFDLSSNDTLDCADVSSLESDILSGKFDPMHENFDPESARFYDFNGSTSDDPRVVDGNDTLRFLQFINARNSSIAPGDFDCSGTVDHCDFAQLRLRIQSTSVPATDSSYSALLDINLDSILDTSDEAMYLNRLVCSCPGDSDHDGIVDFDDVIEALNNWLDTGGPGIPGDADCDGDVDFDDISTTQTNYGPCCEP